MIMSLKQREIKILTKDKIEPQRILLRGVKTC